MKIVSLDNPITLDEVERMAASMFGDLVKAVVDVRRETMAIDAELHSDEEACLLENSSEHEDLWGINLYPGMHGDDFVEFDSMVDLRPSRGNRSRGVEDPAIRERILAIVAKLVKA